MTLLENLLGLFGRNTGNSAIKGNQTQFEATTITSEDKLKNTVPSPTPPGVFDVIVVGVSFYQKALEKICGSRREGDIELHVQAKIVPYDYNPDDVHAVRVEIEGETVGHLSRKKALIWRGKMISEGFSGAVTCPAKIAWDRNFDKAGSYGVWLDLDLTLSDSMPEGNSTHTVSTPPNQLNHIEFLVNQLNRFELLSCKIGDGVNLWKKGESKDIFIYKKNSPFGEGKIGTCPDQICDVLLAATGWDASIASIYEGGCKIDCKLLSKTEMGKVDDENEALDNSQADYLEPSKEDISREMEKWMFIYKKKLDALQDSDRWSYKWMVEETQEKKRCRQSSEFALRWMKPFVRPVDMERAEVRALAVNGLYWSQIIMKE